MKHEIFKWEDFSELRYGPTYPPLDLQAQKIANRIFNQWLEKQTVVYGTITPGQKVFVGYSSLGDTHRARLVCIEEIKRKPCRHEPRGDDWITVNGIFTGPCKHCGVELVAEWREKK